MESEKSFVWNPAVERSKTNEESINTNKESIERLERAVGELTSQNRASVLLIEQLRLFREESREKLAEEIRKIVRVHFIACNKSLHPTAKPSCGFAGS